MEYLLFEDIPSVQPLPFLKSIFLTITGQTQNSVSKIVSTLIHQQLFEFMGVTFSQIFDA